MRIIKFAIGWPLSAVALFFVGKIIVSNGKTVLLNIKGLNFFLLSLGIICFLLFYFIRTYVWKIILRELGYDIPQRKASFLWEISELKRFVPGNIWSFLGRATLFSDIGIPAKTIAKGFIIETQSFLLSCFIISTLGTFLYPKILPLDIPYIFSIPIIATLFFSTVLFINHSLLTKFIKGKFLSKMTFLFPNFSPKANTFILLLSLLYLFLFGSGTYLTITSLTYISPEYSLELSMFFVLALLIGYLSFLTPMGLGVRESVMIFGLSQFVSLSIAGVLSIFARVVLITSELFFLVFTYFWNRTKNKLVYNLEVFVASHKHKIILGFLIAIYIVYFTTASFLRYDNFYTGRFDLGNMDQTVWNTKHGRIFELTDPNGTSIISRLAFHADFILILLSPFYLLWSDPRMLLLIQTIVIALGAYFVYLIAIDVVKNKNISLVVALSFLFNPSVQFTNLYDFHPVTLATTFLLGAFYFLRRNKYVWFLIFLIIAALTKEHVWFIVALFGIYMVFPSPNKDTPYLRSILGKKILGIGILTVSISVFYFLIWHAIPAAVGSKHFALSYYSDFGDSPTKIVKNILLSPGKTLSTIFQKDQLHYLQQLFLPLGFISLFSPLLFFLLPDLFLNLLSNNSQLHQIYYQYSATITPFIFIAAIFGIKSLTKWFSKIPNYTYTLYLIIATLFSAYLYGPLPFAKNLNIDMFTKPQADKVIIENFLVRIPKKYTIASTNNLGSHLSHRQKIFTIPVGLDKADVIAFLLSDSSSQPPLPTQKKILSKVENDKRYIESFRRGNFVVFEKRDLLFAK